MNKIMIILLALALIPAGAWANFSPNPEDYTNFATVEGNVYDSSTSIGVEGATVEVTCLYNDETSSGVTVLNGQYYVFIDCPVNSGVSVTASKEGLGSSTVTGVLFDAGIQEVNGVEVNVGLGMININIPEFPVALLPAMLTVFGVGLVKRRF